MAKKTYIGINNISHPAKRLYIGINNFSKKVKKAYIGVNGKAQLFYSSDAELTMKYSKDITGYKANTPITLKKDNYVIIDAVGKGILTVPKDSANLEIFFLGGGANGGNGWNSGGDWCCFGGAGGRGGGRLTVTKEVTKGAYDLQVGGVNTPSTGFGYNSNNGDRAAAGKNGGYAFNDKSFDGKIYGSGGGGDGASGWDGPGYNDISYNPYSPGAGGGSAGHGRDVDGYSATEYGAGGGGGCGNGGGGGSGKQGLIIIRLAGTQN